MYEIYPSSKKVLDKINGSGNRYEDLDVGQSFVIPSGQMAIGSVRNKASAMGKKLGRKFTVVDHGIEGGYEVARIK